MKPWVVVTRALPLTFIVYALSTLLAVVQAWPAALELERIQASFSGLTTARVAAIEHLLAMLPLWRAQATALALATVAYVLISPWLQMAWLLSLSEPKSPIVALSAGAKLVPRAVLTSLCVGIGTALSVAPFLVGAWLLRSWLEARVNARVQDLSALLLLAPCVPALLAGLAWHDLARARCLSTGGFSSAVGSLRDAVRLRLIVRYVAWSALGLALVITAQLVAWHRPSHIVAVVLTVALVQGAALARSVVRSRWLAEALACADTRLPRSRKGSR